MLFIKSITTKLFFTSLLLHSSFAFGQTKKFINPTGFYRLVSKAKVRNGDVYGYAGDIAVKLLKTSKVVISFYVTRGMPSYSSGSFIDTLNYIDNQAIYKTADDTTCRLIFKFSLKGVRVDEKTANYNSGCGFGHAIVADGFYKKESSKISVVKDHFSLVN